MIDSAGGDGSKASSDDSNGRDSEDEWRFTIEDIEAREAEAEAMAEAERQRTKPIPPGTPSLENTVFVLFGVALALFILSRLLVG